MRAAGLQLAAVLVLIAAVSGGSQAEVIDDILGSLSRAASFLERQHEQINLDGVLGYFMMQGEYTMVPIWKPGPGLETSRVPTAAWNIWRSSAASCSFPLAGSDPLGRVLENVQRI